MGEKRNITTLVQDFSTFTDDDLYEYIKDLQPIVLEYQRQLAAANDNKRRDISYERHMMLKKLFRHSMPILALARKERAKRAHAGTYRPSSALTPPTASKPIQDKNA